MKSSITSSVLLTCSEDVGDDTKDWPWTMELQLAPYSCTTFRLHACWLLAARGGSRPTSKLYVYLASRTLPAARPALGLGLQPVAAEAGATGFAGALSCAKTSWPRHDMLDCSRLPDLSDSQ